MCCSSKERTMSLKLECTMSSKDLEGTYRENEEWGTTSLRIYESSSLLLGYAVWFAF